MKVLTLLLLLASLNASAQNEDSDRILNLSA